MKILFFLLLTFTIWKGQSQDLLLRNVRILDFGKGEFSEPTQLLIQNGKIKAIRPRIKHTHSVDTLDLKGAYAIPGLIDAHVHSPMILKKAGQTGSVIWSISYCMVLRQSAMQQEMPVF